MALNQRELIDRQRDRVSLGDLAHVEDRADLHLAVLSDVERLNRTVENR